MAADVERIIERIEGVLVPLNAFLIAGDNLHDYERLAFAATGLHVDQSCDETPSLMVGFELNDELHLVSYDCIGHPVGHSELASEKASAHR